MNFSQNKSQHANNSIRTWLLCQSVSFHFLLERKGITEQHGGIMQVLDQVVQPFFQYIEQRKQLLNFGVLRQLYLETQSLGNVPANQFTLIYLLAHFPITMSRNSVVSKLQKFLIAPSKYRSKQHDSRIYQTQTLTHKKTPVTTLKN